jgi:hypothetical protein
MHQRIWSKTYLLVHPAPLRLLWVASHGVLLLRGNELRFLGDNARNAAPGRYEVGVQAAFAPSLPAWGLEDEWLAVLTVCLKFDVQHSDCFEQLHVRSSVFQCEYGIIDSMGHDFLVNVPFQVFIGFFI